MSRVVSDPLCFYLRIIVKPWRWIGGSMCMDLLTSDGKENHVNEQTFVVLSFLIRQDGYPVTGIYLTARYV
jgi:hypothetical protein